jgi:hypothetical protein
MVGGREDLARQSSVKVGSHRGVRPSTAADAIQYTVVSY